MKIFGAYLEDYHFIKLIIPKSFNYVSLKLIGNNEEEYLSVFKDETYSNERHLYTSFLGYINLHLDYTVIATSKNKEILSFHLDLGKITRTKRFDLENSTNETLGVFYSKNETIFKVWSPVSKEIKLVLDDVEYDMEYTNKGVWEKNINADILNSKYYYMVRVNEEFIKTLDPYGISSTPNFTANIVVDLNSSYKLKYDYVHFDDPIIEELSIRDITSLKGGGTFKDLTETVNLDYGLGYLKNIGFNHLQIMPIFGFGGVDEVNKDDYNWGYNPINYFSISNYLTKDFINPLGGINELKELIDTIHSLNIGVTLDVVFNHVYDVCKYPYSILVPGYSYHTQDNGYLTNSSGCGNDLNSTKLMIRKLIIDCLVYFKNEFKIDGFRFDLMDLIDVDTLNIAKALLLDIDGNNLMYGEGWNIPMKLPHDLGGLCENFWQLRGFSFFNDSFRNLMKSNFDCTEGGYVLGKKVTNLELYQALTGYCAKEEKWDSPRFSINYIECHDNYTLYDTIIKLYPNIKDEELIDRLSLAVSVIALAQGIPFYHLGMEFGRSKKLHHNSYNIGDEYNGVCWDEKDKYNEVIETLKNVIKLRNKYQIFRFKTKDEIVKYIKIEQFDGSLVLRYYDYNNNNDYCLIMKNDYKQEQKVFAPGSTLIFDGRKEVNEEVELFKFNKPGIYLIKK